MIYVPDTGQVSPGRGGSPSVDTYVRPAVPHEDTSLNQLAGSLSKMGVNFSDLAAERSNKAEAEALRNTSYFRSLVGDIKDGVPIDVQIGNKLPEQSVAVRSRVAEQIGFETGERMAQAELEELAANKELWLNPEGFNAELDRRIAGMRERVRQEGNPAYGNGLTKAYDDLFGKMRSAGVEQRTKRMEELQASQLLRDTLEAGNKAYKEAGVNWRTAGDRPNLMAALTKDKSHDHVRNLHTDFAERLDNMIGNMPPELKGKLNIYSGYRSVERQGELFNNKVSHFLKAGLTQAEAEKRARKTVAPPGKSNHNHGHAVDLRYASDDVKKWVHANAGKFGLYFPMDYEPWHIEMVGGRRQQGEDRRMEIATADGEDDDGDNVITRVVQRTIRAESGGDPTAQNKATTAGGLGQFVDKTWVAEARAVGGPEVAGKSDAQLIAMKTNAAYASFQEKVVTNFTKKNAERLDKAGLPVTEGNLYLMHFAGEGDGPKIIKAADGTRVRDVMDPESVEKNPHVAGMTVAQMKAWAVKQAGGSVDGITAARNAHRMVDTTYGKTSSLVGVYRRDILSKGLADLAEKTGDVSYLDRMPPELMTPEVHAQFAAARKAAEDMAWTRLQRSNTLKEQARQEAITEALKEIDTLDAEGKEIDPLKYKSIPEAYKHARTRMLEQNAIHPDDSRSAARAIENAVVSAEVSGDWSTITGNPEHKTRRPTQRELEIAVRSRPDLKSKDASALVDKIPQLIASTALSVSPMAEETYKKFIGPKIAQLESPLGKTDAESQGINWTLTARGFYDHWVRTAVRAHVEDNKGAMPEGTAELTIMRQAAEATNKYITDLQTFGKKTTEPLGTDKEGNPKQGAPDPEKGKRKDEDSSDSITMEKVEEITLPDGSKETVITTRRATKAAAKTKEQPKDGPVYNDHTGAEPTVSDKDHFTPMLVWLREKLLNGDPNLPIPESVLESFTKLMREQTKGMERERLS